MGISIKNENVNYPLPQNEPPFGCEGGWNGGGGRLGVRCTCALVCTLIYFQLETLEVAHCTLLILVCLMEGFLFVPLLSPDAENPPLPQAFALVPDPLSPQILTSLAPSCYSSLSSDR